MRKKFGIYFRDAHSISALSTDFAIFGLSVWKPLYIYSSSIEARIPILVFLNNLLSFIPFERELPLPAALTEPVSFTLDT